MKKMLFVLLGLMVCCTLVLGQDAPKPAKYVWVETDQVNPTMQQAYDNVLKQFKQGFDSSNSKFWWTAMTPMTGQLNTVTYVAASDTYAGIDAAFKEMSAVAGQIAAKNVNFMKESAESTRATYSGFSVYRPELSLRPEMVPMPAATRYRLSSYVLKPGMTTAFTDLVKEVAALDKGIESAHWMMYESLSSQNGPEFTVVVPLKSLADLDVDNSMQAKSIFTPVVARDIDRRFAQCVTSTSTTYAAVEPRYSRVSPEVVAANPSFWTVKEEAPVMAAKPAKGKKSVQAGQ